jgi:hypothetical protein
MKAQQKIDQLPTSLITEGETVLNTKWQPSGNWVSGPPTYVDLTAFARWRARCKLLSSLLGPVGRPWDAELTADWDNRIEKAMKTQGTLEAISLSAKEGLLIELQDLILAEAFANLAEQADYLLEQGYFLASGVLLRAIVEERLRRLADSHGLTLTKPKPTLNDYNTELYKAAVYDKITFKNVDVLTAIGNSAAHNDASLSAKDVYMMRDGVSGLLQKFS